MGALGHWRIGALGHWGMVHWGLVHWGIGYGALTGAYMGALMSAFIRALVHCPCGAWRLVQLERAVDAHRAARRQVAEVLARVRVTVRVRARARVRAKARVRLRLGLSSGLRLGLGLGLRLGLGLGSTCSLASMVRQPAHWRSCDSQGRPPGAPCSK